MTDKQDLGHLDGEPCNRNGCKGVIAESRVENCSCHISPPCSACTTDRGYCETCGWVGKDDVPFNDHLRNVDKKTGVARLWTLRPLAHGTNDQRNGDDMAFPCEGPNVPAYGLTKREYFAAMAMQGFAASPDNYSFRTKADMLIGIKAVADASVLWADALLTALDVSK